MCTKADDLEELAQKMTVEEPRAEYEWMLRGLCRAEEPGVFFPPSSLGVEVAQRVCAECPVKNRCLEYALLHRIEHGVWGGASERERRRVLRRRREDLATTG